MPGSLIGDIEHSARAVHQQTAHLAESRGGSDTVGDGRAVGCLGTAGDRRYDRVGISERAFPDPPDTVSISKIDVSVRGDGDVCDTGCEFRRQRLTFRAVGDGFRILDAGDDLIGAGVGIDVENLAAVGRDNQVSVRIEFHGERPLPEADRQGRGGREVSAVELVNGVEVAHRDKGVPLCVEDDIHHALAAPSAQGRLLRKGMAVRIKGEDFGFGLLGEPDLAVMQIAQPGDVIRIPIGVRIGKRTCLDIPDTHRLCLLQHERLFVRDDPAHTTNGAKNGRGSIAAGLSGNRVAEADVAKERCDRERRFQLFGIDDLFHRFDVGPVDPKVFSRADRAGDGVAGGIHQIDPDFRVGVVLARSDRHGNIESTRSGSPCREGETDAVVIPGISLDERLFIPDAA